MRQEKPVAWFGRVLALLFVLSAIPMAWAIIRETSGNPFARAVMLTALLVVEVTAWLAAVWLFSRLMTLIRTWRREPRHR
jgi:hypothetical protein